MNLGPVEHFYNILGVIAIVISNHAQKWGQIICKSVQLTLLQNPYFKVRFGILV